MYWPIGSPNVYALTKHAHIPRTTTSNDGLGDENGGNGITNGAEGSESSVAESEDGEENSASEASSQAQSVSNDLVGIHTNPAIADDEEILATKVSRGGTIFATITRATLTVWQTRPTVALASVIRSPQSLKAYGPSTALLLRPDALILVVQTALGYLITYSLSTDPNARVYQTQLPSSSRHTRRDSVDGYNNYRRPSITDTNAATGEGEGIREVNVRFRMVIRIDAGISRAVALDDELVVATQKPAAVQCIRWVADEARSQTSTELLSRMQWFSGTSNIVDMVHDRPMNLTTWVAEDGRAYAVQRRSGSRMDLGNPRALFQGFCFREPETEDDKAIKTAINARFSLVAVGCASGQVHVYAVKDYLGNIPFSHKLSLPATSASLGELTFLTYSPDGYCLFVGYEGGWAMWSVYGKAGTASFTTDKDFTQAHGEKWLQGVKDGFWVGGGCELALLGGADNRIWMLNMARSATTGCYTPANVARSLLYSSDSILIYKGHEVTDLTALPADLSLWQMMQIPPAYLVNHWPVKTAVISPDGKYVAVAGRRGLVHYSVSSGRWKTFDDPAAEFEFSVRGGMCWHQHILVAAVEANSKHQIRLYSREKALDFAHVLAVEELTAPAIYAATSGADSLLVYTYENTLLHYIIAPSGSTVKLHQVGQIGFHGIIRAPPRVRSISWILPEGQLEHGDPSQDVATAAVIFLVDAKLVLLQPSTNEYGELKYDMRVIAQNAEYYMLLRDQPATVAPLRRSESSENLLNGLSMDDHLGHSLRDSLWYFDGIGLQVWSDIQDVLACAPAELGRDLPPTVLVPLDFYPLSAMVANGIVHGVEADLVQRRDVSFSFFRQATRTQLFLPQLLRYHLAEYNSPAALHLSQSYHDLPYFSHALEVLLHDVLDAEVDNPPSPPETALLPTLLSFLSSFPAYLDIIVNCTRKTELRSWQTLFAYLPPVLALFEQSMAQGKLKTAAGYLLVLHTLESDSFHVHEFAELLQRAAAEQDWELCKELARFLVGIDTTGHTLQAALAEAGLAHIANGTIAGRAVNGETHHSYSEGHVDTNGATQPARRGSRRSHNMAVNRFSIASGDDYFSMGERMSSAAAADNNDSFATPNT